MPAFAFAVRQIPHFRRSHVFRRIEFLGLHDLRVHAEAPPEQDPRRRCRRQNGDHDVKEHMGCAGLAGEVAFGQDRPDGQSSQDILCGLAVDHGVLLCLEGNVHLISGLDPHIGHVDLLGENDAEGHMVDGLGLPGGSHHVVIDLVPVPEVVSLHIKDIGILVCGLLVRVPVRVADLDVPLAAGGFFAPGLARDHLKIADFGVKGRLLSVPVQPDIVRDGSVDPVAFLGKAHVQRFGDQIGVIFAHFHLDVIVLDDEIARRMDALGRCPPACDHQQRQQDCEQPPGGPGSSFACHRLHPLCL